MVKALARKKEQTLLFIIILQLLELHLQQPRFFRHNSLAKI